VGVAPEPASQLAARYGRTADRRRREKWWLIGFGAAVAVVIVCWVIWAGLDSVGGTLNATDSAHTVVDDHHVSVSFTVEADPGENAVCAIEAQNEDFAIVGWKVIEIPSSTERSRAFTEVVRTTERAVTGLVSDCWLS
jgi:hypothetical protein